MLSIDRLNKTPVRGFFLFQTIFACGLALAWLLPNHYPPWSSFHLDFWMAVMMIFAACALTAPMRQRIEWHGITVLAALVTLIPLAQLSLGTIMFSGTAWISAIYLFSFFMTLVIGALSERASVGAIVDAIFFAVGVAGVVSVGLQLHQWLSLNLLGVWAMAMSVGNDRPYANIGQPNNLGTLLVWALLAALWAFQRNRIGGVTAIALAVYLLFGLSLTKSRTAWIALAMLVYGIWHWRRLWSNKHCVWAAFGLAGWFVVCVTSVDRLNHALLLTDAAQHGDMIRLASETRPAIWALFVDAALRSPWFGYGWNQVALAQIVVAADHPALGMLFMHSHNLFLDLVLWCGVPLGAIVFVFLLRWIWRGLRVVENAEDVLLMLFVLVVANHALLELPLHHAYFLMPLGVVMGALNVRLGNPVIAKSPKWTLTALTLISVALLTVLARDYSRVELAYQTLRFEWAGVKKSNLKSVPDVVLLDQWREFFKLARYEPHMNTSEAELNWMRRVASTSPSAGAFQRLAVAFALNGQPTEAVFWLRRICQIMPKTQCQAVKDAWEAQSKEVPQIAATSWPM